MWVYRSPWELVGCTPGCGESWQVSVCGHSQFSVNGGGDPGPWTTANIPPVFRNSKGEDEGSCRMASLTTIPGKVMEQIDPETIPKDTKDKKVTGSNQHRFTKEKPSLTNWLNG